MHHVINTFIFVRAHTRFSSKPLFQNPIHHLLLLIPTDPRLPLLVMRASPVHASLPGLLLLLLLLLQSLCLLRGRLVAVDPRCEFGDQVRSDEDLGELACWGCGQAATKCCVKDWGQEGWSTFAQDTRGGIEWESALHRVPRRQGIANRPCCATSSVR